MEFKGILFDDMDQTIILASQNLSLYPLYLIFVSLLFDK
jgi:hypothetical protein